VLRPLGARTIVPGHGPVCGPRSSTTCWPTCASYRISPARQGGYLTPLDAARQADLGGFKDLLDAERIVGNLHRAYLELTGTRRRSTSSRLGDMIAYNGGQPLTCHA
jgi:cyclase